MSPQKPRPGYLFTVKDCPNRDHPFKERCDLCGVDPRAYRLGYRLAPIVSGAAFLAVVAAIVLLLGGCAARPTSPEDLYLNEVHQAAKAEGFDWTKDLQDTALELGASVCDDLEAGYTVEAIRGATTQPDPGQTRVLHAAVEAAAEHLCEGGDQ